MTAVVPSGTRAGRVGVVALFALAFLYELFGAVSDLVVVLAAAATTGGSLTTFAWLVLVAGLVIPIAGFVLALLLARGRRLRGLVGALAVAFCASEALTLSLIALYQAQG